jgi:hypothetical protein
VPASLRAQPLRVYVTPTLRNLAHTVRDGVNRLRFTYRKSGRICGESTKITSCPEHVGRACATELVGDLA